MSIIGRLIRFYMERSAKGKTYADLIRGMEANETVIAQRMAQAEDTPRNRNQAAHVIGIERWGVQRLRSLTGAPLVRDEYDGYRPSTDQAPAQMAEEFRAARQALLALTRQLEQANVRLDQTVLHNDAGPMRVDGWLFYLSNHAGYESKRIRAARR